MNPLADFVKESGVFTLDCIAFGKFFLSIKETFLGVLGMNSCAFCSNLISGSSLIILMGVFFADLSHT